MAEPVTEKVKRLEAQVEALHTLTQLMFIRMMTEEADPLLTLAEIRNGLKLDADAKATGLRKDSALILRELFDDLQKTFG